MPDTSRVFDGFTNLSTGVDGGKSPSLILNSSVAAASNATFRGSYIQTRPPWANRPITVPSAIATRWMGIYQGSEYYDGEGAASGWIISRGGRIFFLESQGFTLKEITVSTVVTTTLSPFTITAANQVIIIDVTTESVFTVGDTILIDGGTYIVTNRFTDQIEVKFLGGYGVLPHTVTVGTPIQDQTGVDLIFYDQNQETDDFAFVFQAENYGIILAGQHSPLIWDGNILRRAGVNEIPPGILGAYGWGRIWIARPDQRTFVAGNLVGDQSSGTAQLGFRDAILKFTDNLFLAGGGAFSVPINAGKINAMQFLATQDTSLGMGVLLVGTSNAVFSVNAPVDRTTWQNLSYPIQTVSLIDYGPQSPRGAVSVNGDMWYRASDGIRAFMVARRDFGTPGNTPMSREVQPILDFDTNDLLFWGSGVYFDNRLIETISPFRGSDQSVQHRGFVVINYDLISDLRQKLPPAWDGVWSGLNVLQITKGKIDNVERCFSFVMGGDVELWEVERQGISDTIGATKTDISAWMESRSLPFTSPFQFKGLYMGELYLDDIRDTVHMTIKFRPDQYPTWVTWATLSFCATISQCQLQATVNGVCQVFQMDVPQYAARVTLPQPSEAVCNVVPGMPPLNLGHEFQIRIEWSGHVRIRLMRAHAKNRDEPMEGGCQVESPCVAFPDCGTNYFTYSSRQGSGVLVPPSNLITGDVYDNNSLFTLASMDPGGLYYAEFGINEVSIRNGSDTFTSPGPAFTFMSDAGLLFFTGTGPALPVTGFVFPIDSVNNVIPTGTNYDFTGHYYLSVMPGSYYILQLSGNDHDVVNGPDSIITHDPIGIIANSNQLIFTSNGAPQVAAVVLLSHGVNP